MKVNVRGQAETYTPVAKEQTVDNGVEPKAKDSIENVAGLPSGTTFTWKDNTPPNTAVTTPGKVDGTVVVHYPDGTSEEVQVTIIVKVTNSNGEPEVQPETPEYTGPISSNGVDGNGNLIDPPTVDIPEFNGAVNGELPDPVELPKVKLIITKWADEQGNELKPADAKTPSKLGEPNEAYEHGTIPGYEFVRTEINSDGDVVTHIFRKVTSIKPEGNGEEQGGNNKPQSTPTSPKADENIKTTQTAKVEKSTKRLANTGESETNTGLAGLGLAMLGSLLAVAKRRREDEE